MALINCSECGKQLSDKASACPHCGAPVETMVKELTVQKEQKPVQQQVKQQVQQQNNTSKSVTAGMTKGQAIGFYILVSIMILAMLAWFNGWFSCGSSSSLTSRPVPPGQTELENMLASMKNEYRVAKNNDNYLQIENTEGKMQSFRSSLKSNNLSATLWVCDVVRVVTDKIVTCSHGYVEYHLNHPESMAAMFGQLRAGDKIVFSGKIKSEGSLTISGAIGEPELRVETEMISR